MTAPSVFTLLTMQRANENAGKTERLVVCAWLVARSARWRHKRNSHRLRIFTYTPSNFHVGTNSET